MGWSAHSFNRALSRRCESWLDIGWFIARSTRSSVLPGYLCTSVELRIPTVPKALSILVSHVPSIVHRWERSTLSGGDTLVTWTIEPFPIGPDLLFELVTVGV